MISMIAAVGKNMELGRAGGLCFSPAGDMKLFRETTLGHKVVMGSNTLKSLPGGKPLPGRENFVLTRSRIDTPGVTEVGSVEEVLDMFADSPEEVFVIGGASIYKQFLEYAKKLYLTEVEAECEADCYFEKFDKAEYDREVLSRNEGTDKLSGKKLKYEFVVYTKKELGEAKKRSGL